MGNKIIVIVIVIFIVFWPFVLGRFSREKPEKGVFLNKTPEIWDTFQKLPEKQKRGHDIDVSRAFNIASREKGVRGVDPWGQGGGGSCPQ